MHLKVYLTNIHLFILISCDRNKLSRRKRLTADHFLDPTDFHNVNPGFIFVQRVQHNLKKEEKLNFILNILYTECNVIII